MASKVIITNKDGSFVAKVGEIGGALIVQDTIHDKVHTGEMFHIDRFVEGVADDGNIEILIQGAAGVIPHFRMATAVGGESFISLFEGTTFSGAGTPITAFNRNRGSALVSGLTIGHTPTLTVAGTELGSILLPGGSGGNANGGSDQGFQEWILDADVDYLVRLQNISGGAVSLGLLLNWYEPGATT